MTTAKFTPTLPLLENGDRLHRAEFERRYAAAPDVKKWGKRIYCVADIRSRG